MQHSGFQTTPTFLANASLGGTERTIRFEQARRFFIDNREQLRRNWRTDSAPVDRDFGAGMESAFRCLCGRLLPLVLAQVDHVATQHDLDGRNRRKVEVRPSAGQYLGGPMTKTVRVFMNGARDIDRIKVTYTPLTFTPTGGDQAVRTPIVGDVIAMAPGGVAMPDPVGHSAKVTPGCTAFVVRAYADQQGASGQTWPVMNMSAREGRGNGVGQGAVYWEFDDPRLLPTTTIHAIGPQGRIRPSMPFANLLKADLTNFQLLCSRCNSSKGEDSFSAISRKRKREIFENA